MSAPIRPWLASRPFRRGLLLANGILLAFLVASLLLSRVRGETAELMGRLGDLPLQFGEWRADRAVAAGEVVTAIDADDWIARVYRRPTGRPLWLYVGVNERVSLAGGGSPHSPLLCYPSQGWEVIESGEEPIAWSGGADLRLSRLLVRKGAEQRLVLYWHQWGGRLATESKWGDYRSKLRWISEIPSLLLRGQRTDRALVRISAPVTGSLREALAEQVGFAEALLPALAEHFSLELR